MRTDTYEHRPSGMNEYLSVYGWHFSKSMCQLALIHQCDGMSIMSPATWESHAQKYPHIQKSKGYDAQYLYARYKCIMEGASETEIFRMVDNYLKTEYETAPLTRFYADSVALNIPIIWEDQL